MPIKPAKHKDNGINHRAALKAFFNIMDLWGVSPKEIQVLLGLGNRQTYYDWKSKGTDKISYDTEERISHILGIYKDLQILFSDTIRADRWVKRPNKFFKDKTPLEVMLDGSILDIARVSVFILLCVACCSISVIIALALAIAAPIRKL